MGRVENFKELVVWQQGMELVKDVYGIASTFPRGEQFGLSAQIKRAIISVPSNIAEGFKRNSRNEFAHFLRIAIGSLGEVETQLLIAQELDFITSKDIEAILKKIESLYKMLTSLHNKTK